MIVKDWAQTAARAIAEQTGYGNDAADSWMRDIILKHCSLKPDTAYMPVPRCDSCRHWQLDLNYKEPSGRCDAAKVWSDCGDYTIMTSRDFGCVQWEAKLDATLPTGCTCGADMIPGRADREHHSDTCPKREAK